jgi:uncharacterized protein (DUF2249 family)
MGVKKQQVITVDVREDLRRGHEPFSKIMHAASTVGEGGQLRLIAPFEPVPLYAVLARQGFSHQAKPLDSGDWEVLFTRASEGSKTPAPAAEPKTSTPEIVEVDARRLEPPGPLVKILEAVAQLRPGVQLHARTDRRPLHLYPQLAERGLNHETTEEPDGSFLTRIFRA